MTRFIILLVSIALFSCQEHKGLKQLDNVINSSEKINTVADTPLWDSLKNLTPLSFLEKVIIKKDDGKQLGILTIEDDETSSNWIKPADIDTLIALTKSKKRCKCIVDPLSSHLPTNDYAELGGYAILLLKQYKDNKNIRFSLYSCPKTDEKEVDELIKWWSHTLSGKQQPTKLAKGLAESN